MEVINTIVGSSVENLISLLKKEFRLITGIEKDVEKLISVLFTIQAVLEHAEEQQIHNKPISDWLRKLKDATYDAEDVLDAWALKIQNIVSRSLPSRLNPKNISFRRKVAKQIKEIISKFDEIVDEQKFQLKTRSESQYNKQRRETDSVTTEPHIYGAEENVTKILDILVNTFANQDDVSVCPIVGMGGLGKTTLAQSVYNDERVQRHFELNIWVCVSEPFDVKLVLKTIVESVNKQACNLVSLEAVHRKVKEILRQKRYLIVLDDVWNENQDEWNKLKSFLKGGAKGSSVVLTTRSSRVASITGTIRPYRLGALSGDDCFSLFKNHALGDKGEELHPNLAVIGKQIAKKCKGVPLVAKSLGSLLRFKTSEKQWESVRDSEIWALDETAENTVLAALRLSYNHLSSRLKQCFAYCAIFPKDSRMPKNKLITSWIANGFIQCQGKMELEEVGDDVFNELLRLSFFQEPQTNAFGTTICKMHDLMHDLASGVAKKECFIAKLGETKDIPKTIRHLSVVCDSQESQTNVVDHLLSPPLSLRTLSFFHSIDFHTFQFSSTLRVLDLSHRGIQTLPPSICDLIHLRYLDLSGNLSLVSLPESIHKLRNLLMLDLSWNKSLGALPLSLCKLKCWYLNLSECSSITSLPEGLGSMSSLRHLDLSRCSLITSLPEGLGSMSSLRHLDLSRCSSITSLPEGLGSLSSLRHLDLSWCYKLSKMPVGIGKLTGLETLNWFVVGNWLSDGDNGGGGASISELQGLNQLRGTLKISGLENVRNGEDAKEANLSSKTHLNELELHWSGWGEDVNGNSKEVLEGLLWHPLNNNITCLEIWDYKAAYFPEVFLQNLKSLKSLGIVGCDELVSLPEGLLQKLNSLEKLEIYQCKRLKSLGSTWSQGYSNPNASSSASSSSHFHSSSLQELCIYNCPEMQFSEEDFQNSEALRKLTLGGLDQLTALPQGIQHLPMLRRLKIYRCENLRIFPAWVKRREKEKGEEWYFYCDDSNIEFGLEEDANEPATEETTDQVNNDENTIIELDGSATEPISDNPNIESAPDEEASEPATEETTEQVNNGENTIVELDGSATEAIFDNPNIECAPEEEANEPATELKKEVNYIEHMARLVSSTVARCILCCCSSSEKKEL